MLQRRRDPVRAGRRPCSAFWPNSGAIARSSSRCRALRTSRMTRWSSPRPPRMLPTDVSSPRSESVRSADRFSFPQTPPNTRHARRVPEAAPTDFPRPGPDPPLTPKPAGAGFGNPRSAGPRGGSRGADQGPLSNPSSSRARPTQARYGHLFSRSRPDKSKTVRLLALSSHARQHPGPPDVPARASQGRRARRPDLRRGIFLRPDWFYRRKTRPGRIRSGPREAENL